MTPEVTQETGRRRTTSEGQYQSSHENTPMMDSPDFAHNLALNPGGRPREVRIQFAQCETRLNSKHQEKEPNKKAENGVI